MAAGRFVFCCVVSMIFFPMPAEQSGFIWQDVQGRGLSDNCNAPSALFVTWDERNVAPTLKAGGRVILGMRLRALRTT